MLHGLHGLPEQVHVEFFEFGTRKCLREIVAILEALNFDTSALLTRECPLGLFNLTLEFSKGAKILGDVGASLLLIRLDQVIDDTVVEIFSTKMSITRGSQYLKDTIIDRKQRNIECSSSKIVRRWRRPWAC